MAGYDDRDGFIWMDGKLVEVDKSVFDQVSGKKKASNEETRYWLVMFDISLRLMWIQFLQNSWPH